MARSSTTWQPGQSGNKDGRPERPFSKLLKTAGGRKHISGVSNKILVTRQAWTLLTDGKVQFADGTTLTIDKVQDWIDLYRIIINHVDGPAPSQNNVNLSGSVQLIADTSWQSVKRSDSQS